jgi:hypothetical protein
LKIEEKYIHPKLMAKIEGGEGEFDVVTEAIRQKNLGLVNEAYALLLEEARENPGSKSVVEVLWDVGVEVENPQEAIALYTQLIEKEIRLDQMDMALNRFIELKKRIPDASLNPTYKFALIEYLIENGYLERAREYAVELLDEIDSKTPPQVVQKFAETARKLSSSIAEKAQELCFRYPDAPSESS